MQKLYGPGGRYDLADPSTQSMVNQGLQNPSITPQFGVSLAELFALKQALDRISVKTQTPNQTVVDDLKNAAYEAVQTPNAMPPQQMAQAPQGLPGLDTGVMENAQFAGGGIIAFADKGEVEGSDWKSRVLQYLEETDELLGLPPGTSERQIKVESNFNPMAVSEAGAQGLVQLMPKTLETWRKRTGEKLDAFKPMDAVKVHRLQMKENMRATKGNVEDALRMYNAGPDRSRWNNPETIAYVPKIMNAEPDVADYDVPVGTNLGLGATPEGQPPYKADDLALGGVYAGGIAGAGAAGAALRGAPSSVPKPGAPIPSGTNFFVGPGGVAAAELGARDMGTRGVPMVRPNTLPSTNVSGPAINASGSAINAAKLTSPITPDAFARAQNVLGAAGRVGRLATGPGGLALGLGLGSSEAGAGSDVVPGREAPEGFMAGMQAAQSSEKIQDILEDWNADNARFYAAEDDVTRLKNERKNALEGAKGRDRFRINKEYQSLIEAASNKVDEMRKGLSIKDEATGRLPIIERYGGLGAARQDPSERFAVKPEVSPTVKAAVSGVPGVPEAVAAQQEKYAKPGSYHGEFDSTSGTDLFTRSAEDLMGGKGEDKKEAAKPVAVAEDSDTVTKNNIDALKAQMEQARKDRDVGYLLALAQAGFAMAASKSPYALQAVAEGANIGVKAAQDITKDYIKRDDLLKRYQREEEKEGAARRRNAKKDAEDAAHKKERLRIDLARLNSDLKEKTYEQILAGMVRRKEITLEDMQKRMIIYNRSKKGPTIGESVQELRNLKGPTTTSSGATTSGEWGG